MKKIILTLCFFSIYTILANDAVLKQPKILPNAQVLPNDINSGIINNQKGNFTRNARRKYLANNGVLPQDRALAQDKIVNQALPDCPPIDCVPCIRSRRLRCKPKCIVPRVICCPKAKPTVCREPLPFCCPPPRVRCCKIRKICFPRPLRCCPQPIRCIPKAGICPIAKPRCPNGQPTPCATCYNPLQYSCSASSDSLIAPGPGIIPQRKNRSVVFAKPIEQYNEAIKNIQQEMEEQKDLPQRGKGEHKEVTQQLA